jgi:hypothetical protein
MDNLLKNVKCVENHYLIMVVERLALPLVLEKIVMKDGMCLTTRRLIMTVGILLVQAGIIDIDNFFRCSSIFLLSFFRSFLVYLVYFIIGFFIVFIFSFLMLLYNDLIKISLGKNLQIKLHNRDKIWILSISHKKQ